MAAPEFVYPSAVVLQQINQELVPRLAANRAIFDIMPMREVDSHLLEWEQKDNYMGLQQIRGLNGQPSRVKQTGGKRYAMQPGIYGEFELIDEQQLTTRRQWGTLQGSIDVTDLVREKQDKLLQRRLDRIEQIGWTLLATGTFSVTDGASILHTDTFTLQTYSAGVTWATAATATPLADLRAVQLKSRGYSVNFGAAANAYMNRSTANAMLNNTNNADIYGRRVTGLATANSLPQVNALLAADDLPQIIVYDDGYYNDAGVFTLFVPNNKVVIVGARKDNDPVAEYRFTRNANNAGFAPGPYMKVVDDPDEVPRSLEVHDGHNGGPVLYHPAAIVVMTV
jgi:Phage major capsid protein E